MTRCLRMCCGEWKEAFLTLLLITVVALTWKDTNTENHKKASLQASS
jgi:hypothetical protein